MHGDPGQRDPDEIGCLVAFACPILAVGALVVADLAPLPDLPPRWAWVGGATVPVCLSVGVLGPGAAMFLIRGGVRRRILAACLASVLGVIATGGGLAVYTPFALAASE